MNGSVEDVAFMDDGDTMLSFGSDAKVYVWDMKRRTCINTFEDRVRSCINYYIALYFYLS